MSQTEITLKTIAHLRQESVIFAIDAYQRGFRWTPAEVRDLLNDVREFSLAHPAEGGAFYCLQPVVVASEGDGKRWKVIDGQQRLTTLFLFYCCYSWLAPPEERYNLLPFSISYTGKPRLQACLDALTEKEYVSARKMAAEMAEYEDDMDCHYLLQAYQCIGEMLQALVRGSHTRDGLRLLKETFDWRVKLIWHEAQACDAAAEAALFTRLNTGKIPLTNAELVKALLLERHAEDAEWPPESADGAAMRARIATQWREMEESFGDSRFWSFLTGGRTAARASGTPHGPGTEGSLAESPTRLDLLFHVMALEMNRSVLSDAEWRCPQGAPWTVSEAANGERFSFYVFSNCLRLLRRQGKDASGDAPGAPVDAVGQLWERVREVYRMFRNWYENPKWYHRIGFLLLTSTRPVPELLTTLCRLCRDGQAALPAGAAPAEPDLPLNARTPLSRAQALEEKLLRMITEEVFGTARISAEACREWVTGLVYPKDARKIRQVLLLYNLACLEAGDAGARFPFERYRDARLNWDLEHINAVSDAMPGDDRRDTEANARRQWLKKATGLQELGQITTADGRPVSGLIRNLLDRKTYLEKYQPGTPDFVQAYEAVLRFFDDAGGPDHAIGNLTLLDGGLNRAYRNDVFPLKRRAVLERSVQGTFIPLGTQKVFMKGFPESTDLLRWRERDKRAYTEEIIRFLCSFLKLEQIPRQPEESGVPYGRERPAGPGVRAEGPLSGMAEQPGGREDYPAGEASMPYIALRREESFPGNSWRTDGGVPADRKAQEAAGAPGRQPEYKGSALADRGRIPRRRGSSTAPVAATRESFWSLVSGRGTSIRIPPLQRDYAHGRRDAQTERIRKALLDDLFRSLRGAALPGGEDSGLDLGFLYGNVDEKRRFVPVDGQQRLTTLFLLHWLLAFRSGRLDADPDVRRALLRFQYETRETSGRFCRQMVLQPPAGTVVPGPGRSISDRIRGCGWFREEDGRDPTVAGMLVMLDALQEQAAALAAEGVSAEQLFSVLTSEKPPVWFLFLNLDDAGLTDSIYIKMNARGRPLTFFESFKAGLPAYLRQDPQDSVGEGLPFSEAFLRNLNGPWTEFLWRPEYRMQGEQPTTDVPTLRLFRFLLLTEVIAHAEGSAGQAELRGAVTTLTQEPDEVFFSRLFRDGFREAAGLCSETAPVTPRTFRLIGRLLDLLMKQKKETGSVAFWNRPGRREPPLEEEAAFRRLIGAAGERPPDYEEMILLYAEYRFLLRYARPDGRFPYRGALRRWLRLVSNLTRNIRNLQADVLFHVIRAVSRLTESGFALHCEKALLGWPQLPEALKAFPASQIAEEALKAALRQRDGRWKRAIDAAEGVFPGGRIDMLFDFSGIRAEEFFSQAERQNPGAGSAALPSGGPALSAGGPAQASFVRYLRAYRLLFNRFGVRPELEKDALLRRALLCYGGEDSYLLPPGRARQSFLDNADRDFGFRRLFRDGNSGRRAVLKQLLDDLDESRSAAPQLRDIIRRKTFRGAERWKEYFVTMPEILSSVRSGGGDRADPMGEWVFQTEQRFIRRNSADDILLLSRTQTSSVSREYYSYVLFLKARQRGLPVYYHADYTDSAEKYAWFESPAEGRVRILYRNPDGKGWRYVALRENDREVLYDGTLEEMLDDIAGKPQCVKAE